MEYIEFEERVVHSAQFTSTLAVETDEIRATEELKGVPVPKLPHDNNVEFPVTTEGPRFHGKFESYEIF